VEALQLEGGDVQVFFDGGVVEVFQNGYDKGSRVPAPWVGVKAEPRKNERLRLTFGRADPRDQPVYGPDLRLGWTDMRVEVDAADDAGLRAFFAEVARVAGRPGPA
jgi:hypothetical protein